MMQTPGPSKRKGISLSPRIDMTPMVDLGFLLITFFIFTSSLAESRALQLFLPADGPPSNLSENVAISFILGSEDRVYYFEGDGEKAMADKKVFATSYHVHDGIGLIIRNKKKALGAIKNELMVLFKPSRAASYQNLVNCLDEVLINGVKRYAITDLTPMEEAFVNQE